MITLGQLLSLVDDLEKFTYDRWLGAPTIFSPSSKFKLGMNQM